MDSSPNNNSPPQVDQICSNPRCADVRQNSAKLVLALRSKDRVEMELGKFKQENDILRGQVSSLEATVRDMNEQLEITNTAKQSAESELLRLKSDVEHWKKKCETMQVKADEGIEAISRATEWRQKYDDVAKMVETVDRRRVEIHDKYVESINIASDSQKRLEETKTKLTQSKEREDEAKKKLKTVMKYAPSAVNLIDQIVKEIDDLQLSNKVRRQLDTFRRDDVRFSLGVATWNVSAVAKEGEHGQNNVEADDTAIGDFGPSVVDMPKVSPVKKRTKADSHGDLGLTLSDDEDEEAIVNLMGSDDSEKKKRVAHTAKRTNETNGTASTSSATPSTSSTRRSPRKVRASTVVRKPAPAATNDRPRVPYHEISHSLSQRRYDFNSVNEVVNVKPKNIVHREGDSEADKHADSKTTSIHGRKGQTVRQMQAEMMKVSVKDRVAKMREMAEKSPSKSVVKGNAVKKDVIDTNIPTVSATEEELPAIVTDDNEQQVQNDEVIAPETMDTLTAAADVGAFGIDDFQPDNFEQVVDIPESMDVTGVPGGMKQSDLATPDKSTNAFFGLDMTPSPTKSVVTPLKEAPKEKEIAASPVKKSETPKISISQKVIDSVPMVLPGTLASTSVSEESVALKDSPKKTIAKSVARKESVNTEPGKQAKAPTVKPVQTTSRQTAKKNIVTSVDDFVIPSRTKTAPRAPPTRRSVRGKTVVAKLPEEKKDDVATPKMIPELAEKDIPPLNLSDDDDDDDVLNINDEALNQTTNDGIEVDLNASKPAVVAAESPKRELRSTPARSLSTASSTSTSRRLRSESVSSNVSVASTGSRRSSRLQAVEEAKTPAAAAKKMPANARRGATMVPVSTKTSTRNRSATAKEDKKPATPATPEDVKLHVFKKPKCDSTPTNRGKQAEKESESLTSESSNVEASKESVDTPKVSNEPSIQTASTISTTAATRRSVDKTVSEVPVSTSDSVARSLRNRAFPTSSTGDSVRASACAPPKPVEPTPEERSLTIKEKVALLRAEGEKESAKKAESDGTEKDAQFAKPRPRAVRGKTVVPNAVEGPGGSRVKGITAVAAPKRKPVVEENKTDEPVSSTVTVSEVDSANEYIDDDSEISLTIDDPNERTTEKTTMPESSSSPTKNVEQKKDSSLELGLDVSDDSDEEVHIEVNKEDNSRRIAHVPKQGVVVPKIAQKLKLSTDELVVPKTISTQASIRAKSMVIPTAAHAMPARRGSIAKNPARKPAASNVKSPSATTSAEETAPSNNGEPRKAIEIAPRGRKRGATVATGSLTAAKIKRLEQKSTAAKSVLHQALGMKQSPELVRQQMGSELNKLKDMEVDDVADVIVEYIQQSARADLWRIVELKKSKGQLENVSNQEEENILQCSYDLTDCNDNIWIPLINRIVFAMATQTHLDASQCGSYIRVLCHAVHFSKTEDSESIYRRVIRMMFFKHESQAVVAVVYCLLGLSWQGMRWIIDEIDEETDFSILFRALVYKNDSARDVVLWLLRGRFDLPSLRQPTADEVIDRLKKVVEKFNNSEELVDVENVDEKTVLKVSEAGRAVLHSATCLVKTHFVEVLSMPFDVMKEMMENLERIIEDKETPASSEELFKSVISSTKSFTLSTARRIFIQTSFVIYGLSAFVGPQKHSTQAVSGALRAVAPQVRSFLHKLKGTSRIAQIKDDVRPVVLFSVRELGNFIEMFTRYPIDE